MSTKAVAWAIDADLPPNEKLVLIILADMVNRMDETHSCYPSQTHLVGATGLSRSTVIRSLKSLEEVGAIRRERRHREDGMRTSDLTYLNVGAETSQCQADTLPDLKCQPDTYLGVREEPMGVSERHPNLLKENRLKENRAPGPPSSLFDAWWQRYPKKSGKIAARKAFTKALTVTTPERLDDGLTTYLKSRSVARGYVKDPATWLNQGCWDDEPDQQPNNGQHLQPVPSYEEKPAPPRDTLPWVGA